MLFFFGKSLHTLLPDGLYRNGEHMKVLRGQLLVCRLKNKECFCIWCFTKFCIYQTVCCFFFCFYGFEWHRNSFQSNYSFMYSPVVFSLLQIFLRIFSFEGNAPLIFKRASLRLFFHVVVL